MCKPGSLTSSSSSSQEEPAKQPSFLESSTLNNEDLSLKESGIKRCKVYIEVGVLFLSMLYGSVYWYLKRKDEPWLLATAEHCQSTKDSGRLDHCHRPDLFAYKVTSFVGMVVMGVLGVKHWYFSSQTKRLARLSDDNGGPQSRLLGNLPAADAQNVAILVYQLWDFVVFLTIPEFVDPIFLTHHALAALCAYSSLEWQLFTYYAVYFGGCAEISSIFLVLADVDEMFHLDPLESGNSVQQFLPAIVELSKGLFVLTFTYVRVMGWIYWSIHVWSDALKVKQSKSLEELRKPGASSVLNMFLVLNVLLGALQLYWFGMIVLKLIEMASATS